MIARLVVTALGAASTLRNVSKENIPEDLAKIVVYLRLMEGVFDSLFPNKVGGIMGRACLGRFPSESLLGESRWLQYNVGERDDGGACKRRWIVQGSGLWQPCYIVLHCVPEIHHQGMGSRRNGSGQKFGMDGLLFCHDSWGGYIPSHRLVVG